jgi:hypothetical protein
MSGKRQIPDEGLAEFRRAKSTRFYEEQARKGREATAEKAVPPKPDTDDEKSA